MSLSIARRTRVVAASCAVAAFAGAVIAPSFARATSSGPNGRIAFMRTDAMGYWQIWTASARLTDTKKLTGESANSGWPAWSPDGSRLAFDSSRGDSSPIDSDMRNDVFVMNADGSDVTQLTTAGFNADPSWSPDGSLIAFDSDIGDFPRQAIYVMRSDGTDARRIVTLPSSAASDLAPRFSPDGTRLVFSRIRSGNPGRAALFTVRLDGTGLRRLTPFSLDASDGADWSPDGQRLVFEAHPSPDSSGDVETVGIDGRHPRNLTRNLSTARSVDPVWSPDGTEILFLDRRVSGRRQRTGLATIRPDGSGRAFLAAGTGQLCQPDWQSLAGSTARR